MTALQVRGHPVAPWLLWVAFATMLFAPSGALLEGGGPPGGASAAAPVPALSVEPSLLANSADPPPLPPVIVGSVDVGTLPVAGAVDLANGLVYVANSYASSNSVSVLNGTSVLATIDLLPNMTGDPLYVAYDPVNGYVYVVDQVDFEAVEEGAVNVINGTSVVATLPVGGSPDSAVVDPANGYVYVTNTGSANVSVLDGKSVIGSVPVGADPTAAVFDAQDDYIFVANEGSNNVSVVYKTYAVGSVAAGSGPSSIAYDPLDTYVYVTNSLSDNVTVYFDASPTPFATVPVGSDPTFVAYNPSVGGMEVVNSNSNNVTVLSGTAAVAWVPVGTGPAWVGLAPFGVYTFVVDENANEVTLLEGTTPLGNITVGSVPVYGVADPVNELEYVINSGSNNTTVFAEAYPVTFNETGLAPGVSWSVTLGGTGNSSTSSTIGFVEPNGTYTYTVATPAGYELVSEIPPSPIVVQNAGVLVNVTFAPLPSATYVLTFAETGLAPTCSPHEKGEGALGLDGMGQGGCCMGSSSLPAWSVTVDGVTKTTTSTSLAFSEPDGTYAYTVGAPSGYTVSSTDPPSPVTIDGANLTVSVVFAKTAVPLSITFAEKGLPPGTVWCVTVGTTECSSARTIVFSGLSPGTYSFVVGSVPGYRAHPASGSVTLSTRSVTVLIRFSAPVQHRC